MCRTRFIECCLVVMVAITFSANAFESCFVAKENGKIVKESGKCTALRHSPNSSFKIPLALIGFESGILIDKDTPRFELPDEIKKEGPDKSLPVLLFHHRAQTPESWMKYSVVWYSQEITKKLGMQFFKDYVTKLKYGNMDVSGTKGKNDGLTNSWLSSSLEVSPLEQIEFLEKLSNKTLPFKKESQEKTIQLIKQETVWDDWTIYGKTGSSGSSGKFRQGWFVGWIEKGSRRILFAQHVVRDDNLPLSSGVVAKDLAKDNLVSIILNVK